MLASRFGSIVLVGLVFAQPAASEDIAVAAEALAAARLFYREAPRFAERLDYAVRFPEGRTERKAIEYGRSGDRLFVAMLDGSGRRVSHLAAADGRLRAVQFNIGGGFVEGPFDGSLVESFRAIGADRIGLTVPPGLAASEPSEEAFLEAFGFGVVGGIRPLSVETGDGTSAVTLAGEAGTVVVRLDATTGRLTGLELTVGQSGEAVRIQGEIGPIRAAASDPRWAVDTSGRRAVATFAELEAAGYPLGSPAPDLEIRTLDGEVVSLASMRGRVVILDFWATWCVPCWSALEHLERVAKWVRGSNLPIEVWAVDTAERAESFEEQAAMASKFLDSRGLDLRVLLDVDGSFFAGMHSPGLPSTVVIAPDGTVAHYHSSFDDEMEAVLRTEALALLEDR